MVPAKILKAVIPVAGLGTRLLPATKSQPKEMLLVGRKPCVHRIVEEQVHNGIEQVLFITGASKKSIEDYFDYDENLVRRLRREGKEDLLAEILFDWKNVHFFYTRQHVQLGLGDAILYAEDFVGPDPFVIALGDSVISPRRTPGQISAMERMRQVFFEQQCEGVIIFEQVPHEHVCHYGIAKFDHEKDATFMLNQIIEKPSPERAPSNYAVAGRYIFTPSIFKYLKKITPGVNQELQLTDAIEMMIQDGLKIMGVVMNREDDEHRFDVGNYETYYQAFLYFALRDPKLGPKMVAYFHEQLKHLGLE